ncbi:winged helix-turn-helix domain-containing protein [Zymomonas mobilis]|uniref:winged helix-turn-helix domain-containing protein n=1 Tax=Zymomonas mobilis TaxID=542 RepID=UPI0001A776A1|nr:winged helix-turn-helix domain-containing protein [Zymomonas mobilis]
MVIPLMLPVLLLAAVGEQRVADAAERIADELGLTPDEREEMLPSGRQRLLHNRIHWAKFYMSKAGAFHRDRSGAGAAGIQSCMHQCERPQGL